MQRTKCKSSAIFRTAVLLILIVTVFSSFVFVADGYSGTECSENHVLLPKNGMVAELSVSARSAILIEEKSGKVIWSKNADERLPMASTTKIMTALVAIENSDVSEAVEVSPMAVGIEGSSIYLYEKEKLTLEDLLYALLLESANDAAAAIAIEIGGSIEGFAEMMNDKASELGLKDTHFTNPHGLDDAEHFTTARELAIITKAALENETFKSIVSTFKKTIPLNETEGVRLLINHNKMLKSYNGAIGVKTGYTKKSGRCLVSAAERDGVGFICVTLNAPDDWKDHHALLDHGFSLYESRIICKADEINLVQDIVGGTHEYVTVMTDKDISVILPKSAPTATATVELFPFTYAPVESGEKLGRIIYKIDGKVVAEAPLYASYAVEMRPVKLSLWERLLSFLGF